MKRMTHEKSLYSSDFLRKLQAYENIGTPEEFAELKAIKNRKETLYVKCSFGNICQLTADSQETFEKLMKVKDLSFRKLSEVLKIDRKKLSQIAKGKQADLLIFRKMAQEVGVELEVVRG